jgi:hypothetical protein
MTRGGKGHATAALDKTPRSYGEEKTLEADVFVHESVQAWQQAAESGVAFQLVQSFGVNTRTSRTSAQCGREP